MFSRINKEEKLIGLRNSSFKKIHVDMLYLSPTFSQHKLVANRYRISLEIHYSSPQTPHRQHPFPQKTTRNQAFQARSQAIIVCEKDNAHVWLLWFNVWMCVSVCACMSSWEMNSVTRRKECVLNFPNILGKTTVTTTATALGKRAATGIRICVSVGFGMCVFVC